MKRFLAAISLIFMYCSQALVCIVTIDSVHVSEDFKNSGGFLSVIGASGVGVIYTDKGYTTKRSNQFNAKNLTVYSDGPLMISARLRPTQESRSKLIALEDIDVPGCKSGNENLETHYKVILSDDMQIKFLPVEKTK